MDLTTKSTSEIYERIKILNSIKHKGSPDRRITKIERELGLLKKELRRRYARHNEQ